jgi:chemotaxis family two-component system sensor kinase Cph1
MAQPRANILLVDDRLYDGELAPLVLRTQLEPVDFAAADAAACGLERLFQDAGSELEPVPLATLDTDARRIPQRLQNLFPNVLKLKFGAPPRIRVSAARGDDGWRLSLTDDGIGVAPLASEWIFRIFQRLHSIDERLGSGTGLAISRYIVECHRGRIRVDAATLGCTIGYKASPAELGEGRKT